MDLFLYTLRSIIALIGVLWLVNFVLKYIDRYANKQTKSIQVIERASVSKSSSIAIVKVMEQYYVMSISENSTEILEKLSDEDIINLEKQIEQQQTESQKVFDQQFIKQMQKKWMSIMEKIKKKKVK